MSQLNIPEGYQQVMPYLIVKNADAFSRFMQAVFGAAEKMKVMRDEEKIMHAELQLGESTIMFSDATAEFPQQNAALFVYVADCDTVYDRALGHGASPLMAPDEREYGRSAGIRDAFGNTWWITGSASSANEQAEEE
ncbi:VOC family protein [Mucilaginibacter sp. Bleaf8]|uniref:VOC family protein n=1 Tax=Mucilaginibacter sp. Bleaf8 TaxID=2834430 RepID=UPI001BD02959|nr:VOC family protein [Mucilaginibacter sp. Bleaf8]MBS7566631.1 VOC family protein [Mucilaginibacter sp. Bleaf8]